MSYPNILFGPEGLQYKQSTSARQALGQMLVLEDGRRFRYAKNGATAAVQGMLFQSAADTTRLTSAALTGSPAIGDKTITFSTASHQLTTSADVFAGGYLVTNSSVAGGGQLYKIETHPAISTATGTTNTITLAYGVVGAAITSGVRFGLIRNPYSGVIIHPSPPTAQVVGWTQSTLAASNFGWLGTAGVVAGLVDRDPQLWQQVTPSTALDGAVNQAYLRIAAGTSAVAFSSASPTSLTFQLQASTGGDASVGVFATSTAIASAAGTPHDVGMQQPTVGYALSCGLTSGMYGPLFATLDG